MKAKEKELEETKVNLTKVRSVRDTPRLTIKTTQFLFRACVLKSDSSHKKCCDQKFDVVETLVLDVGTVAYLYSSAFLTTKPFVSDGKGEEGVGRTQRGAASGQERPVSAAAS